jgi:hypothetical protein
MDELSGGAGEKPGPLQSVMSLDRRQDCSKREHRLGLKNGAG